MAHNRLVIDGYLGGGVERWSCSIGYATNAGGGASTSAALGAWAESARAAFGGSVGWEATVMALLGSNGGIDRVRTYYYPDFNSPASAQGVSTGGAVAGTGSLTMPPQCSLVVSLLTGQPGRRYRGRIYWPNLTSTIGTTLKRTGNPSNASLPGAFANMLRALGNIVTLVELDPVVVSQAGGGALTPVSSVSIGDVIDTQRRRRDALVETRVTANIPA